MVILSLILLLKLPVILFPTGILWESSKNYSRITSNINNNNKTYCTNEKKQTKLNKIKRSKITRQESKVGTVKVLKL